MRRRRPNPLTRLTAAVTRATVLERYALWRSLPVDRRAVLYESFGGNGALCNPEAIFRALLDDPAGRGLRHVWSLRAGHDEDALVREFQADRRVRFVREGSGAYLRALATSGHLVNNATFPRLFSKRPGQVYLNTWHGVPLKKMGFDIGDPPSRVANVVRNFLHADVLLSAGPFMTDQLYRRAHRLDGIYPGRILEVGYPRNDAQFAGDEERAETRRALAAAGIDVEGRELILVAPTWKGASFLRPENDSRELLAAATRLQELLGERYRVALKTHQVVHRFARDSPEFRGILVPNDIPANRILAVADQLVTDYSSIFFDFTTTGRPIRFLVPDLADYTGYRGLYLEPGDWPGTVSSTVDDLARAIVRPVPDDVEARRDAVRRLGCPNDDGHAAERVVRAVFGSGSGSGSGIRLDGIRLDDDRRPSAILLIGGPSDGWAPEEVNARLEAFDLDRIDVSLLVSDSRRRDFLDWLADLDPRIRVLVRQGAMNGIKARQLVRRIGLVPQPRLWRDEWVHIVGDARFDRVEVVATTDLWRSLGKAALARRT